MTVQNVQNSVNWWSQFYEEKKDDSELKNAFSSIQKADVDGTEESLKIAINEVEKLNTKKYKNEIKNFNRKIKILEKRLERKVSDDFGAMLKYLREKNKLSLAQLSELTGISASYISRIEIGERKAPSYPIIEKLANALGVPISNLLNVASSEDNRNDAVTISQLIYSNNIKLSENGKPLNVNTKEQFIELINFIINMEWKDNKHTEMLKLIELLDEFK